MSTLTHPLQHISGKEKKTRQTEEEVGRHHQGLDRPGVLQVPEAVENREKRRKLVMKSSVVPQQPSLLGVDDDDDDDNNIIIIGNLWRPIS